MAVDNFRHPWESDEHWDLRKGFIEEYYGKFDEDKLSSLSNIYFNVEILGCSYSAEVTEQIKKLIEGLPPSKRAAKKEQVTFIPESSNKKYKLVNNPSPEDRQTYNYTQNRQTAASFFSQRKY